MPPEDTPPGRDPLTVSESTPEREELLDDPSTLCLNCGKALPGAFCPSCGQKAQALRQPVHHFLRDAVVEFFGLDGRVVRSLGVLLFKPGRLTRTYIEGKRMKYLRPLRIYLSSTLLFFVLLATLDPVGRLRSLAEEATASDEDLELVSVHRTSNDSLLTALPLEWEQDDAERDSLRAVRDSLVGVRDRLEALSGAGESALVDSLDELRDELDDIESDLDPAEWESEAARAARLSRIRTESVILAEMPQDSLINPENLHVLLRDLYPTESDTTFVGPEWLARSASAQMIRSARTREEQLTASAQFARDAIGQVPTVMFIVLPIFALLMKVLYARRDWFYSEHVVFALHTHAFAFLCFALMSLMIWGSGGADWTGTPLILLSVSIPLYFLLAMKHVYQQGWGRTLVKAWLLAWMYGFVLMVGLVGALLLAAVVG